jgi:histidinol dehydrogenase
MRRFDARAADFAARFSDFLAEPRGGGADVATAVAAILSSVRERGLEAVLEFGARFDGVALAPDAVRVSEAEIAAGAADCPPEVREALAFAADRIEAYHARLKPQDGDFVDGTGVRLGWRWRPLESVGVYVPGGRAAYPSTVLMNAVPAKVAGVGRIAMVTPPGRIAAPILAAARIAGVTEIWRIGGAQAVAALAYGAGPIAKVHKIVGPGNVFVTEAKRQVYGQVGIDALAGPSEIVVVADNANPPDWIAADLLSQAEHDPDAQSILITDDGAFADRVCEAIDRQLSALATREAAAASWRAHGAVVLVADLAQAAAIVDLIAPEHVEIATENARALGESIHHAGAVFMGRYAPEAIGDYVAGSNHVLPTSGAARFSSGLSTIDFMKRSSMIDCPQESFAGLGRPTVALAEAEGLPAHALSAAIRL